jgi:hypothetical protein
MDICIYVCVDILILVYCMYDLIRSVLITGDSDD